VPIVQPGLTLQLTVSRIFASASAPDQQRFAISAAVAPVGRMPFAWVPSPHAAT
jgi:hypothetical protein